MNVQRLSIFWSWDPHRNVRYWTYWWEDNNGERRELAAATTRPR